MTPVSAERGQSAVETALTLPLTTFMVLGTLQLFMLLQAKVMAQYAVFQATRVGSVTHAECMPMTHAAILALLPTFVSYMGPSFSGAGSAGQRLGAAFGQWKTNLYGAYHGWGNDDIVWIARERPNFVSGPQNAADVQRYFDTPIDPGTPPTLLEIRMIYWAPLQIPFADWVFTKIGLAHLGIQSYVGPASPFQLNQKANWVAGNPFLFGPIQTELLRRATLKHYAFPIDVSSTMRMMTPVNLTDFNGGQNCGNAPPGL